MVESRRAAAAASAYASRCGIAPATSQRSLATPPTISVPSGEGRCRCHVARGAGRDPRRRLRRRRWCGRCGYHSHLTGGEFDVNRLCQQRSRERSCQLVAVPADPRPKRQRITDVLTLALVGFLGGLITGISPCILPVLPVIFFSGAQSVDAAQVAKPEGAVAVRRKRALSATLRPYRVIGGLVLSFGMVTLLGSALLSVLHLPQDAIRWAALVALVAIGAGLIFPRFEQLLENRSPVFRRSKSSLAATVSGWV